MYWLILVVGTMIIIPFVCFLLAWFRGDQIQQFSIDQVNKWPEGIPFKQLNLRFYEWRGWIWLMRIFTTIALLASLCISAFFMYLEFQF